MKSLLRYKPNVCLSEEKCSSMAVRKEDLEEIDETEGGRSLKIAIVDGRKLIRRWEVRQRGKARELGFRSECVVRMDEVRSCEVSVGGPWPCIKSHSKTNLNRRRRHASSFVVVLENCRSNNQRSN